MAELLVRAKGHWMDGMSREAVDQLPADKRAQYEARTQIGDVIAVRPDGWQWGKRECPPDFVIIKAPDLPMSRAREYEEPLYRETTDARGAVTRELVAVRSHRITTNGVALALMMERGELSISRVADVVEIASLPVVEDPIREVSR